MKLSQIINRLKEIKESRGDLNIEKVIANGGYYDTVCLGRDIKSDAVDETTLRFMDDLPF